MGLDTYAMMENPHFNEKKANTHLWFNGEYVRPCELPDWAEVSGMAVRQKKFIRMPQKFFAEVPNVLCGGLFSGNGAGPSFRGKIYNELIEELTGVSLYQEEIPNTVVKGMADSLGVLLVTGINSRQCKKIGIKEVEVESLAKWFRVVADNNGIVVGWW